MKKFVIALMTSAGLMSVAQAQVSANLGITSDYRFRGVSQSQNAPAVQGGLDLALPSGLYVGNWNSSVSSELFPGGSGVEVDLYAGYKREIGGYTFDVGSYNYFYPRAAVAGTKFDTREIYAGVSRGPITLKVSQSMNEYFGIANSKGTRYYQADIAQPLGAGLTALAHIGRTDVANNTQLNYTDINLGVAYDISGWTLAGRWYVNSNKGPNFTGFNTVDGQRLGKGSVGLTLSKVF
jgi:uncharacterized protein (TIGR02001 family)